jgi:hypothetical protein
MSAGMCSSSPLIFEADEEVCKNSNAVMVKTSAIQVRLRAHLYGIKGLDRSHSQSQSDQVASKHLINIMCNAQHSLEYDTHVAESSIPCQVPLHSQIVDVQDGVIMVDTGTELYFMNDGQKGRSIQRLVSRFSTFKWCSMDAVVVESRGYVGTIQHSAIVADVQFSRTRFGSASTSTHSICLSTQSPQRQHQRQPS